MLARNRLFKVLVKGAQSAGMRWVVQEPDGGQITERGIYTAPGHVGRYHVVAFSERDPSVKAVVTVTIVTELDTPNWLRKKF